MNACDSSNLQCKDVFDIGSVPQTTNLKIANFTISFEHVDFGHVIGDKYHILNNISDYLNLMETCFCQTTYSQLDNLVSMMQCSNQNCEV